MQTPQQPMQQNNPLPPPTAAPAPVEEVLQWSTPAQVRHSVRVICDQEGLTLEQKNTLCATVECESAGFNTKATHANYVIEAGKKILASTDWGLCQWNDYYHGKEISPHDALNDPEKAVRLMCEYWKLNRRTQWVCYSTAMYKKYL